MSYNISKLIRGCAASESCLHNSADDSIAESMIDSAIESIPESYYKIPYGLDAMHLIKIGENYFIPYRDMVRICEKYTATIPEVIPAIANHYKINENAIVVMLESEDCCCDLAKTSIRILDAIENSIPIFTQEHDFADDCVDMKCLFGEDAKLIDDDDDDDMEIITEEDPEEDDDIYDFLDDDDDMFCVSCESVSYTVDTVNVYSHEFDFYVEFAELERYMDYKHIDSVTEAVYDVAAHNEIPYHKIKLLVESKSKLKSAKSKKTKTMRHRKAKKAIKAKKLGVGKKLKIGWLDTANATKGIKKSKKRK